MKYKNIYIKTKKVDTRVINMAYSSPNMKEIMKEYEKRGMRPAFPNESRAFKEGRRVYCEFG